MTVPKLRAWFSKEDLMIPDHCLERHVSGTVYEIYSPLTGDRLSIGNAINPNYVMQSFHVFDNSEDKVEMILSSLKIITLKQKIHITLSVSSSVGI